MSDAIHAAILHVLDNDFASSLIDVLDLVPRSFKEETGRVGAGNVESAGAFAVTALNAG